MLLYKTLLDCQCCLGRLHQSGKGKVVTNRQIGQDLAIDFHPRPVKAIDEAVVGETMQTNSGVDAGYPEAAKLTFALSAMLVRVIETVDEGFAGSFQKAVADTTMPPRLGDHLLVPLPLADASLDPSQMPTPLPT
jgi:hypothetical protein